MQKLVECVPNFSEGRNQKTIQAIFKAAKTIGTVKVFELEFNSDHNRMLFTIVGAPQDVYQSVYRAITVATKLIDMTKHQGEHPRIGATDVVPFVPVAGVTMQECVVLAKKVAKKVASDLKIPVYLYEAAASRPERVNLADVRRGEYEGLKKELAINKEKQPDFGPAKMHPSAGAMVVGARQYLIAFNVNLKTGDISIAKAIAAKVREKGGGLPAVKALGFAVGGKAQISMNLCDYQRTNFDQAYREIKKWAGKYKVKIGSSEIYGMLPLEALVKAVQVSFKADNFHADQILETRICEKD